MGCSGGISSQITLTRANTGRANIIPMIPNSRPPITKAKMAAKGLTLTCLPTIFGVKKLPSMNCTIAKIKITPSVSHNEPV